MFLILLFSDYWLALFCHLVALLCIPPAPFILCARSGERCSACLNHFCQLDQWRLADNAYTAVNYTGEVSQYPYRACFRQTRDAA